MAMLGRDAAWTDTIRNHRGSRDFKLVMAIDSTKYIQFLWVKHYGKKNRKRGEPGAAEFAARMWKVPHEALLAAIKERRLVPSNWRIPADL